jgi:hypothetical protein
MWLQPTYSLLQVERDCKAVWNLVVTVHSDKGLQQCAQLHVSPPGCKGQGSLLCASYWGGGVFALSQV